MPELILAHIRRAHTGKTHYSSSPAGRSLCKDIITASGALANICSCDEESKVYADTYGYSICFLDLVPAMRLNLF